MEPKKLTEEELNSLKDLQQRSGQIAQQLGSFEIQRLNLEAQRTVAEEAFAELRNEELKISQELFDKYGNGSLNLEKGEFIPITEG